MLCQHISSISRSYAMAVKWLNIVAIVHCSIVNEAAYLWHMLKCSLEFMSDDNA
jgi:hypothetical protein